MLHVICNLNGLESCQRFIQAQDAVIFLGEASAYAKKVRSNPTFAIDSELQNRKLSIPSEVGRIDYDEFVELVAKHQNSVTWS